MPKEKQKRSLHGLKESLRKRLQCSVQYEPGDSQDFYVGTSFVLKNDVPDVESEFSRTVIDLIERKGEVEVHNYVCTAFDITDLMSEEDIVTLH